MNRPHRLRLAFALFAVASLSSGAARAQTSPPAVATAPANPLIREALAKAQAGDVDGAIRGLEGARAQLDAQGQAMLGALYLQANRPQEALAVLEPLTRQGNDPAVLYNAARAAAGAGRGEDSAAWLARAAQLDPSSPANRDLGILLARRGLAVEGYARLLPWILANPGDGDARLIAASLALQLERPNEADELLRALDGNDPAIKLLRAKVLMQQGKPGEAVTLAQPLLASHPEGMELEVRTTLAEAQLNAGRPAEAVKLLAGRAAGRPAVSLLLARAQRRAGDSAAALATLQPLATKLPANRDVIGDPRQPVGIALEYAALLVEANRAAEAVPVLQKALDLFPQLRPLWEGLATTLAAAGRADEAATARARADELGRQAAAEAAAAASPAVSPEVQAQVREFQQLLVQGRFAQALPLAEQMLASDPRNPDFLYQRGAVQMAMRQTAAAEKDFRAALAVASGHVPAMNDLAVLLASQGKKDEARQLLQRVLSLRPNDPAAAAALRALDQPAPGR